MKHKTSLLGIFGEPDSLLSAARLALDKGYNIVEVYSPCPVEGIDEILGKSRSSIRYFTLLGGFLGCCAGFALTIGVALRHGIITGGKPVIAIPPFLVIAFELSILVGALATLAGFLLKARLPGALRDRTYHCDFSSDRFGLVISCEEEEINETRELLISADALEVKHEQS
jgi:hypothetical protein